MTPTYKANFQGGREVINMPKGSAGKYFTRSVWKDGSIVFKEVVE